MPKKRTPAYKLFTAAGLVLLALAASPSAAGAAEMYAGASVDTEGQMYSFVGAGVDRGINQNWAYTLKAVASYLTYEFESGGVRTEAAAPGASISAGVKHWKPGMYLILMAGAGFKDTDLDPDDIHAEVRGGQVGLIFEIVYGTELSRLYSLETVGSYNTLGDSLWGRARLKRLVPSASAGTDRKIYIGTEAVAQGNEDYSAWAAGALLEFREMKKNSSITVSGGYRNNGSIPDSAYIGLEFYKRF